MTFATDETGIETSRPREGIEIVLPAVTYRISTSDQDIVINGFTYKANPASRGPIPIPATGNVGGIEVSLPVSHPAVQRYLANGTPPQQAITITIWRQQKTSGEVRQEWTGQWTSLTVDRHVAKIQALARVGLALQRRLPTITVGRGCSHVLYDSRCTVNRASFTLSTTVASYDGAHVVVASMSGKPDQWAQYGELLHVASGGRVTIGNQVGTAIDMQVAIPEMKDGDAIQVVAGCTHIVTVCLAKFANVANFGGLPNLPMHNAFAPSGYGVVSQT